MRRLPALAGDFLELLFEPGRALSEIAGRPVAWRSLVLFLILVGLLRGLLESVYILLHAGHFLMTLTQPYALRAYALTGSAFLAANVVTALVRWVMFGLVAFWGGRWLGGHGNFDAFLRVFAVALGVYPLTILPDYAYLFWPLPALQFHVSAAYNPVLGIGQVAVSIWLAAFGYLVARRLHGLGRLDSILCGLALELFSLGSLVIGSMVFFNLPAVTALSHDGMILSATAAFTLVTAVAGAAAWKFGRQLEVER